MEVESSEAAAMPGLNLVLPTYLSGQSGEWVCVHVHVCVHATAHVWRLRDKLCAAGRHTDLCSVEGWRVILYICVVTHHRASNFMHQLDWTTGYPGMWLNII